MCGHGSKHLIGHQSNLLEDEAGEGGIQQCHRKPLSLTIAHGVEHRGVISYCS